MNAILYKIQCITNIHMGNGEINFNVVDNEVQKDPVTNYPSMYPSGIKGALREHFLLCKEETTAIFGSDKAETDKNKQGELKFLTGELLSIPVRSSRGYAAYYMATTISLLRRFFSLCRYFDMVYFENCLEELDTLDQKMAYKITMDNVKAEHVKITEIINDQSGIKEFLYNFIGENAVILPDEAMKEIDLPVLARNQLEKGKSNHLWYEEIVPHSSIFYFYVLSAGTDTADRCLKKFEEVIKENPHVQFGGNATIGYGLTELEEVIKNYGHE